VVESEKKGGPGGETRGGGSSGRDGATTSPKEGVEKGDDDGEDSPPGYTVGEGTSMNSRQVHESRLSDRVESCQPPQEQGNRGCVNTSIE